MYSNTERFEEAIDELLLVIKQEAGHAEAYNSLGFVYSKLGDFPKAEQYLSKAIEIRPEFTQARDNLRAVRAELSRAQT